MNESEFYLVDTCIQNLHDSLQNIYRKSIQIYLMRYEKNKQNSNTKYDDSDDDDGDS